MKKIILLFSVFFFCEITYGQTGSVTADSLFGAYETSISRNKDVLELIQITLREGKKQNSSLRHIYIYIVKKDSIELTYFHLFDNKLSEKLNRVLDFSEAQYIEKVISDFKCFNTAGNCWHEKNEPIFYDKKKNDMKYVNFSKNEWFIKAVDKRKECKAPENPYKIGFKTNLFHFRCKSLFNNIQSRIRFMKIKRILEKV
jgi:hypothetical protein